MRTNRHFDPVLPDAIEMGAQGARQHSPQAPPQLLFLSD